MLKLVPTHLLSFLACAIASAQLDSLVFVFGKYANVRTYLQLPLGAVHKLHMSSQNWQFLTPSPLLVVFLLCKIGNF